MQQEAEPERISLVEWIEWGVFIGALLAYWPLILVSVYQPEGGSRAYGLLMAVTGSLAYELFIYGAIPVALVVILIRRIRLFLARVEEEQEKRTGPRP